MTFKEKLEKFKSDRVGFRVDSEGVAKELAKMFTKEGIKSRSGRNSSDILKDCLTDFWEYPGTPYVAYNYTEDEIRLS